MANGPVADPATKLAAIPARSQVPAPWTMRIGQGVLISRMGLGQISASAISAAVAVKDIWKPGWTTASGSRASTIRAATARACRVMARRSARTATKATDRVIADRMAGGGAPEMTR